MKFKRVAWLTLAQAINSFGSSFSVLVLLRWPLTHKVFAAETGVHAV